MHRCSVQVSGRQLVFAEHQEDKPGKQDMWLLPVLFLLVVQGEWGRGFGTKYLEDLGET